MPSLYRVVNFSDPTDDFISRRILSFLDLADGWHYGDGRAATQTAVNLARSISSLLVRNNADEIEVFPDVSGGILVSGYYADDILEIFCSADGNLEIEHRVEQDTRFEKDGILFDELTDYLWRMSWKSMKLSDLFTQNILANESKDLRVWYSRGLLLRAPYRSSTHGVPESEADPSANTLVVITTRPSPDIPSFSGAYQHPNFRKTQDSPVSHHQRATNAT